eukprot:TRINITY_DN5122_c0_g1_i1.p1 TRINITY_DN5122_c0_g1~~TRINITY_DN5122_c0_g1_i1.p1  ORF type:complete len:327 (-),score=55.97 TRINITY_DN5122_c0_g1_i1:71-961(-)
MAIVLSFFGRWDDVVVQIHKYTRKKIMKERLPSWWDPKTHDRDLLLGIAKFGFGNWPQIRSDPSLAFFQTAQLFQRRQKKNLSLSIEKIRGQGVPTDSHSHVSPELHIQNLDMSDSDLPEFPKEKDILLRIETLISVVKSLRNKGESKKKSDIPPPKKRMCPQKSELINSNNSPPSDNPDSSPRLSLPLPLHISSSLVLDSLGFSDVHREAKNSSYPVGYRIRRILEIGFSQLTFCCEVLSGPIFRVALVGTDISFVGSSTFFVWKILNERVQQIRERPNPFSSGDDFFWFYKHRC